MPERPGTSFNRARAPPDIADAVAVEDVMRVTSSHDFDGDARVARIVDPRAPGRDHPRARGVLHAM